MGKAEPEDEKIYAADREQWRAWLRANHSTASRIRLVYYKVGSEKQSVSYDEAVEEAICFGWIDSKVNSIDDERYMQLYTPRKKGSIWSKLNKSRVEKVIREGRMTAAGQQKIDAAKADGSWALLDQVESMEIPPDLADAFETTPTARATYDGYSNSLKKRVLYHLASAKRPATRQKRLAEIVAWAEAGVAPGSS
jgi:uncharacterized protein YdeI (YjbR/CyaY-like superfamily)